MATQDQDHCLALEQENALLKLRLQACEQAYAVQQAELAYYRQSEAARSPVTTTAENVHPEQRLWAATIAATNALLTLANFDEAVNTALQIIGEALDTDRVNVIENVDLPNDSTFPGWRSLGHEWNSAGTVPQQISAEAVQGRYGEIPEIFERLSHGQVISYLIEEAPEPFRSAQMESGVKSTHLVPIFVESQWWGVLGLDDCRQAKQRSAAELSVLKIAADCIGSAIQRQRTQQALLAAEQNRAAELANANEALRRSITHLTKTSSLQSFLTAVLQELIQASEAVTAAVFVYDPPSHTLQMTNLVVHNEVIDIAHDARAEIWRSPIPADITNAWDMLTRQREIIWTDFNHLTLEFWSFSIPWHERFGHKAIAAIPLFIGKQALGFLGLGFSTHESPNQARLEHCWSIAQHAALALQMTRLAEEAKQAAVAKLNEVIAREQEKAAQERVTQLAKANTTLKRTLDVLATEPMIDRSLGHVLRVLTEQLESSSSALWLYNPDRQRFSLHLVYLNGDIIPATPETIDLLSGQWTRGRELPHDLTFKQHIRDRKPVIYEVADLPKLAQQFMQQLGVKTLLGVPLLLGSEIIGSFTVRFTETRQFQAEDLELTQALAHQATLAVQLTHLFTIAQHETQQAAILGERNRMARELHDTLAQTFTGIIMQLEATQAMITPTTFEPAQKHLQRAGLLARQGLQEALRSVWSLRFEALESADLPTALLRIAQQMTDHTTIQTDVIVDGSAIALPAELEDHLLRIGQEALTNALKHAQPQQIQITLNFATDTVQLQIKDDGQGFDPQQQWRGYGITCMQERTHQLGGEFNLRSQVGQGTTIHVTIPLAPSEGRTA